MPLYSQVSFSNIRYSKAYENGKKQEQIMKEIMKIPNIEKLWILVNENKILSML